MTRIKTGVVKHRRHKKVLAQTKGHQGVRHTLFRIANESLLHALRYSYLHRKRKKMICGNYGKLEFMLLQDILDYHIVD